MIDQEIKFGIVGAGGFAKFALQAFARLPQVTPIGITDIDPAAAEQLGSALNLKVYANQEQLLEQKEIDLIYVATPPAFHYAQSRMALQAGKHVICEKPGSFTQAQALELAGIAGQDKLLYTVNLMQRYNPLYSVIKAIIDEGILGSFLHGFFENYASDESLPPGHWFWDISKSGGIFIEHGVHFFDLFSGWLGRGTPVFAMQMKRPDQNPPVIERVQATVQYNEGWVNFYHGFDQPKNLDRQEMRLLFEHGEITLLEWVPVKMKLHGLISQSAMDQLIAITSTLTLTSQIEIKETRHLVKGRGKTILFDKHLTIEFEQPQGKLILYQEMLTAMMADQCAWIRHPGRKRTIDENNAIESLAMAERATQMAITIQ